MLGEHFLRSMKNTLLYSITSLIIIITIIFIISFSALQSLFVLPMNLKQQLKN